MFKLCATLLLLLCSSSCALLTSEPQYTEDQKLSAAKLILAGNSHLEQNDFEAARASYQLSYDIVENAVALDGLGTVYHRQKDYQRALAYYRLANALDPEYPGVLANIALLYHETGNTRQALEFYELANERDPKNFRLKNNFSVASFDSVLMAPDKQNTRHAWELINMAKLIKEDKLIRQNYLKLKSINNLR